MTAPKPKRRPEKLLLCVTKGGFIPADGYTYWQPLQQEPPK